LNTDSNKIVLCTLGPASLNAATIRRLAQLSVGLFRLNLSHTRVDQLEGLISLIQANSDVPICLDTQGAQVRTGPLPDGEMKLKTDTVVRLVDTTNETGPNEVPLYPASVLPQLMVGDVVSIDFNIASVQVLATSPIIRARVLSGGSIGSNKAASIDRHIFLEPLTDVDLAAIDLGLRRGIKNVALSFANRQSDVEQLRKLVGDDVKIIAKVESRTSLDNLDGIMEAADAILIDRGDMGREVAIEYLPFVQKKVIAEANAAGVPVYVATNLLESMMVNPRPTRAEANDVINTLLDGADGLVLAAETAIGAYPVGSVRMIRSLIRHHEARDAFSLNQFDSHLGSGLISAHGGRLIERLVREQDAQGMNGLPRLEIGESEMLDVRQIAIGTFSPLEGFMDRETLESVLEKNRLPEGTAWPMPVLLQVSADADYPAGETVALTYQSRTRAIIAVDEVFSYDLEKLAKGWFGTTDTKHPGVKRLLQGGDRFVAGKVSLLPQAVTDREAYELTPAQARRVFESREWQRVVGFHTRNVPHRAHEYLQLTALANNQCDGIFIHPVTGPKKTGDFSGGISLKAYQLLIDQHYPPDTAVLGGFVTYSRYAGPREAVFTAICRQNFGCSHFIVGRDHTGVGDFYTPDASQRLFDEIGDIGIEPVFFDSVYYCQQCRNHVEGCEHGREFSQEISGTEARELLRQGEALPDWFIRTSVSQLIVKEIANGGEVFAE
jgi:pyruvate kinase